MKRLILSIAVAAALMGMPGYAAELPHGGTIYLHDFLSSPSDVNCSNDVIAQAQAAVDAWMALQRTRSGADLELGSGCYYISRALNVGDPGGAYMFGTIAGDGPDLTSFHHPAGTRAIVISNLQYADVGGFSVVGQRPGELSGAGCCNEAGVVIGNRGEALGTTQSKFHDIRVTNEQGCFQIGDPISAGSAANNNYDRLVAVHCNIGFHFVTYNTLTNIFDNVGCANTRSCFYTDNSYGLTVRGGGGTHNDVVFNLRGPAEQARVTNWREESMVDASSPQGGATTVSRLADLGGAASVHTGFVLEDSAILTTGDPVIRTFGPTAIQITNSLLRAGSIDVLGSSLDIAGSKFGAPQIVSTGRTPQNLRIFATSRVNPADGSFISWFPNTGTGGSVPTPGPGAPTPTPAPVASYVTRWDSNTPAPTARGSFGSMTLGFTNMGNTDWQSPVKLTYWWIRNGAAVLYGDRTLLGVSSVPPGGRVANYQLGLSVPSTAGQYTLHLTLIRDPNTIFGASLDLPVTVS